MQIKIPSEVLKAIHILQLSTTNFYQKRDGHNPVGSWLRVKVESEGGEVADKEVGTDREGPKDEVPSHGVLETTRQGEEEVKKDWVVGPTNCENTLNLDKKHTRH